MDKPAIKTNTDTGLLKAIAFATMLIDHLGYVFFPGEQWLRIIGRIAFPLFAYCLVLGFTRTKNLKKYFLRLLGFALISQIPYHLCFFPEDTLKSFHLNIGFTLVLGLCSLWGIREKKYLVTAAALIVSLWPAVEYSFYGVCLITVMYVFLYESKAVFGFSVGICLMSNIAVFFAQGRFDIQVLAILALPLMLLQTKSKIEIPRLLNYSFYPLHLLILWVIHEFTVGNFSFSESSSVIYLFL